MKPLDLEALEKEINAILKRHNASIRLWWPDYDHGEIVPENGYSPLKLVRADKERRTAEAQWARQSEAWAERVEKQEKCAHVWGRVSYTSKSSIGPYTQRTCSLCAKVEKSSNGTVFFTW